ncbi:flavin-containing monooxygenase [Streptomyces sp. NBC_01320]|uniref:flavin-containing monooxygenase n=1 Tax=Streptomyces sp. NBC_01320 TaxID=2903824 RepID=UPI002E0F4496|nr:NAD(P)/FAD-dependent oxidoreductase [Streptomyces sp. NBC_01320]
MTLVTPDTGTDDVDDAAFEERLAWALEDANLPTILAVLTHLTGNWSYLQSQFAPGPMRGPGDHDDAGLAKESQRELRATAHLVILDHMRGALPQVPAPTPEQLVEILSLVVGDDVPANTAGLLAEELGTASRTPASLTEPSRHGAPHTLIVGTGFSGLAAAIRLEEAGLPFTIIDKNDGVGGTWHENTYPGCGVDTPVHLYSFAFAQRPDWPRYFAGQGDVQGYLVSVAEQHGIREKVQYGTELESATWNDTAQHWSVTLRMPDGTRREADYGVIVSAVGQFNRPSSPKLPGLDTFTGPVVHTAAWDPQLDLAGKRVAVVGSGASAMQLVPAIRRKASHVTVFQRSPQWILPNPNAGEDVSEQKKFLMAHVPWYLGWYRLRQVWNFGDRMYRILRVDPSWEHPERSVNAANERHRVFLTGYIERQLKGRPELIEASTPAYPPYGKRPLLDHGWFESLTSENVDLVPESVAKVDQTGVTTRSGRHVEVDVIVLATGFDAINMLGPMELRGRSGATLRDTWGVDDARAYLGMSMPDFPNFFMLFGPNTNAGHGGSLVMTVEMQVRYILELLTHMSVEGIGSAEVRTEAFERFMTELDQALEGAVWSHPGMTSYYRNAKGRIVTNLPWTNAEYWTRTRHVDLGDYVLTPRKTATGAGPET